MQMQAYKKLAKIKNKFTTKSNKDLTNFRTKITNNRNGFSS